MKDYISFGKKLFYIIIFGGLVWFISFSIFPENQVIKISVGEESPATFLAPKYIEITDEEQTNINPLELDFSFFKSPGLMNFQNS